MAASSARTTASAPEEVACDWSNCCGGNNAFLKEPLAALKFRLAQLGLGFIPGERCFSLGQSGMEGVLIQSDQQVAFPDKLALPVMDLVHNSGNL